MRRRQFIQNTGLLTTSSLLGPGMAHAGRKSEAPILVCLFQRGGADGLNMVVPHGDDHYYDLRPNLAVNAESLFDLDGYFGLPSAMSPLIQSWQQGELAIVHAAGSPSDSRSHFDAQDFMELGSIEKNANVFDGWLNRYLLAAEDDQSSPFKAIGLGPRLPLALRGQSNALSVNNLAAFELQAPAHSKLAIAHSLEQLNTTSLNSLSTVSNSVFSAVDQFSLVAQELPDGMGSYPATPFGRQLQDLATIIQADIGLEVACVEIDGWDHHDQEAQALQSLLEEFSQGLVAFSDDLGATMERVTVVTMTEFGRRAAENASEGTDHGHGSVMLALGGAVRGGIYGDWPGLSPAQLNRGDLEVTTDFRSVLSDLLRGQMNYAGQLETIFPNFNGPTELGLSA